jgi:multiple sugar transport system permease protein
MGLTGRARAERKLGWMLTAPSVVVMLLVAGFPIIYAFWLSLHRADLRFPNLDKWVGLKNYGSVLSSSTWWNDIGTTVIITVISVSLELVIGMFIAQAMYRAIFARTTIRASVLVPYGAVTVVAAFAWRLAFDPATGFVTQALGINTPPFTNRAGSLIVIILAEVWKTTPFIALLLLGGLALIPEDLYKAAKMDGATSMQRFFRITLPLIRPALMVALLFRTLDAFRIYDTVFIMTRGANNTETVSVLGYQQLVNRLNLGLGSAVSILIFFCVVLIAFAFTKLLGSSPTRR